MTSNRKLGAKISGDFGLATVDGNVAKEAAKAVVLNALDTEDAKLMLDMLGLIPPQPEYLPFDHDDAKKERLRKSKIEFNKKRVERNLKAKAKKILEQANASLIGEGDEPEESFEDVVARLRKDAENA